ncbi:DnaB-like helicase C-terminal domain-containing protein [Clostridium chromiireducens]|uniref:DnaB-like helicase C-terminal domain-containing protein n=1 Tax=Clostridium chromiireducens TaxID=225345 RepID=UPI003AF69683
MKNHNLEVETQVLGNCISSKDIFLKVLDKGIEPEDFYSTNNQKLFYSLIECFSMKGTTDIITFYYFLEKHEVQRTYATNILTETINFSDITPYLNELLNLRMVRERIKFAKDIQSGVISTDEEIQRRLESIDFIKSKVGNDNTITTLDKVKIVDIYTMEKIPTGFKEIDDKLLGFVTGSLSIITGYNANGKSTLINQMCIAESISRGYKVFAYSPELTNSNLKSWLYPTIADADHFITKFYNGNKYKALGNVGIKYIDNWIKDKLFIYTDDSITSSEKQLMQDMNRLAQQGVKVFIIDNLMKIELEDERKDKLTAQKKFVNNLKNFARKYAAIVHLVAHLKKPEKGESKISKFDIAGSGDITNLADYVISISRVSKEDRDKNPILKDSVIKVMKDRIKGNGEFAVTLSYDTTRKRFYSNNLELNKEYGYINNLELVQVEMGENL